MKTDLPAGGGVRSVAGMDKLEEIFRMQDALNQRIGVTTVVVSAALTWWRIGWWV